MFESIIDYISRTNLFNFIIFAGILSYLFVKLDVIGSLNSAKDVVAETIETSESKKESSEIKLHSVEERFAGLEKEIDNILNETINNAELVGKKILSDADKSVNTIHENSQKLMENKTALMRNDILQRASNASVEVAKNHIINELSKNYDLHYKFIDESIEAIEGVEL